MSLNLLEKDVQKACEDILQWDGWRLFRLERNWSPKKKKAVGETGAPDTMAVRYLDGGYARSQVVHIEWKRVKGGRLSPEQWDWHRKERARGALTWIAGETFEPNYESFKEFYEACGLCNRRMH